MDAFTTREEVGTIRTLLIYENVHRRETPLYVEGVTDGSPAADDT